MDQIKNIPTIKCLNIRTVKFLEYNNVPDNIIKANNFTKCDKHNNFNKFICYSVYDNHRWFALAEFIPFHKIIQTINSSGRIIEIEVDYYKIYNNTTICVYILSDYGALVFEIEDLKNDIDS